MDLWAPGPWEVTVRTDPGLIPSKPVREQNVDPMKEQMTTACYSKCTLTFGHT